MEVEGDISAERKVGMWRWGLERRGCSVSIMIRFPMALVLGMVCKREAGRGGSEVLIEAVVVFERRFCRSFGVRL
jgi:hypothetical protein